MCLHRRCSAMLCDRAGTCRSRSARWTGPIGECRGMILFELRDLDFQSRRRLTLVERQLTTPLVKRYSDGSSPRVHGTRFGRGRRRHLRVCAIEYEAWHARLVLWHLYVSPTRRARARPCPARPAEAHGRAWPDACGSRRRAPTCRHRRVRAPRYSLCGLDHTCTTRCLGERGGDLPVEVARVTQKVRRHARRLGFDARTARRDRAR